MWRRIFNGEIALGFMLATLFWIAVLGWQAAYAPTDKEKQECYEAAKKSGHKTEECKTLWERTTSDPITLYTFGTFIFTGVLAASTIFLWIATRSTAIGGERAANIAQDALTKLERAFVSITFSFNASGNVMNQIEGWQITPVLKNEGSTNTRGLHQHVSWDAFFNPIPDDFTFPDIWDAAVVDRVNPLSYIAPHGSINGDSLGIPTEILEAARQGHLRVYMWGWAEYDDVFEETPPHRTEFCYEIRVFRDPYVFVTGQLPFSLRIIDRHTGADEDCYRQARPRTLRDQPII